MTGHQTWLNSRENVRIPDDITCKCTVWIIAEIFVVVCNNNFIVGREIRLTVVKITG